MILRVARLAHFLHSDRSSFEAVEMCCSTHTASFSHRVWYAMQFSGVHEIPLEALRSFVDAFAAGHAATLPTTALEPGTTPLGSGGYATVYSATLSSSCIAGAEGDVFSPLPALFCVALCSEQEQVLRRHTCCSVMPVVPRVT